MFLKISQLNDPLGKKRISCTMGTMKPCMENEELIPFILLAYINSQTQKFPWFTGGGTIVASIFVESSRVLFVVWAQGP